MYVLIEHNKMPVYSLIAHWAKLTLKGADSQTISNSPLKLPSAMLMSYLLHGPRWPLTNALIST